MVIYDLVLGVQVKEGAHVAVLEAMKMQNVLKASRSGIVKTVHSEVGVHTTFFICC